MSRRGLVAGLLAGLSVAGTAAVLADRRIGQRLLAEAESGDAEQLGSLRGTVRMVTADDGLSLYAEVDERAPYGTAPEAENEVTVVLVHGFALTLDCWHFQRQALRGRRRLVLYDQRSHGRSERSTADHATIDQLGRDLAAVLDQVCPTGPVVLVGHSMGGMTIVALAEQQPELFGDRVVGVGLISTTAGGMRSHRILSRHIPDSLGRRAVERGLLVAAQRERLIELARQRGSAVGLRLIDEFSFGDEPVPLSYVTFIDAMIAETPLSVLVEFLPEFDLLDKFEVVAAFERVPTWIMCGTKDKLTSIGHARKLHASIDGSRLVELEGGGHLPILGFKDRVNQELLDLLAAAEGGAER